MRLLSTRQRRIQKGVKDVHNHRGLVHNVAVGNCDIWLCADRSGRAVTYTIAAGEKRLLHVESYRCILKDTLSLLGVSRRVVHVCVTANLKVPDRSMSRKGEPSMLGSAEWDGEGLAKRVLAKLRQRLRLQYANLEDVLRLCECQLRFLVEKIREECEAVEGRVDVGRWIEEKAEQICADMLEERYVRDCERIAQYLQDDAENDRICLEYRWEYDPCTEATVRAVLVRRCGKHEAEVRVPQVQDRVQEEVFGKESFRRVAKGYAPNRGRRFQSYLKQAIVWATLSEVRGLPPDSNTVPLSPGGIPDCGTEDDATIVLERTESQKELSQARQRCCSELCGRYPSDSDRGIQECAAVELRFVDLIAPDDMMTLKYVVEESKRPREFFVVEYEAAKEAANVLERKLPCARYDRDRVLEAVDEHRRALERAGYTVRQMDVLRQKALRNTKKELKKCDNPRNEREYMISYHRYDKANSRLESLHVCQNNVRVRSEKQIGELLGVSQPTACRRLKAGLEFLRTCLAEKGLRGAVVGEAT